MTPEIDRRILAGYLGDRAAMIEELGREGISKAEILKRGEQLGLSTSFVTKCQADGIALTLRRCLGCEEAFISLGPQNRMCRRCRHRG